MNALTVTLLLAVAGYVCAQECSQDDAMKAMQCVTKFSEKGAPSNKDETCKLYTDFKGCIDKLPEGCKTNTAKAFESVEKMMKEQGFDCGAAGMVQVSLFSLVLVFLVTFFLR